MYTIKTEIILGIFAAITFFALYKFSKRLSFKIDESDLIFGISVAVLGSFMRILEDVKIFPRNFFTVTPGIWYIVGGIGILEAVLIKYLKKGHKPFIILNLVISSLIFLLVFQRSGKLNSIMLCSLIPLIPLVTVRDKSLFFLLFFSALDSIVPIFSTNFLNYIEQHPIPRKLMEMNPLLYPIVRLSFSYFVFLILNKEDEFERAILYGIILISCVTSVRSFFRALLGV